MIKKTDNHYKMSCHAFGIDLSRMSKNQGKYTRWVCSAIFHMATTPCRILSVRFMLLPAQFQLWNWVQKLTTPGHWIWWLHNKKLGMTDFHAYIPGASLLSMIDHSFCYHWSITVNLSRINILEILYKYRRDHSDWFFLLSFTFQMGRIGP